MSVHRMLWVAVGALVASAPGVQAEEGQQRYTSRTTPHVTCVTRHAQNAKPTSRCRTVAPWSTTMRRVFHPETNGVKASPHRLKWMLSRGALAAPSDPWNFDASQPAGQDPDTRLASGTVTLPLCSRTNASPFWIMLLRVSGRLRHGMIPAFARADPFLRGFTNSPWTRP